jgi:hypothetical protein
MGVIETSMSIGYVHLFALPPVLGDSGTVQSPVYQFTFNNGGHAFSKVFDQESLLEFMTEELALRVDLVEEAMELLTSNGRTTIPNVELTDNQAAAFGLQEVGADY